MNKKIPQLNAIFRHVLQEKCDEEGGGDEKL